MKIFIVCPAHIKTGGTELLHQFSKSLSVSGIENYMIYLNPDGVNCPTPEAFKVYNVKYVSRYVDAHDSVLVIPESRMRFVNEMKCEIGTLMIWWLAVDNYLLSYKNMIKNGDPDVFHLKSRKNTVHFVQSWYAKEFLKEQFGIEDSYFLMDYINDGIMKIASLYQNLKYERKNICLYNPVKGYETLKPVIEVCRKDIVWMPLVGYKAEEMAALMCLSKVYVDFGCHPGKDRIPREAAICGCCVLTNRQGSAAYQEDVGIPECYKIADTGNIEGILKKLYLLIDDYEEKKADFSSYRETIKGEKAQFMEDLHTAIDILESRIKS